MAPTRAAAMRAYRFWSGRRAWLDQALPAPNSTVRVALRQLHQRPQHPVGGRWHAQRLTAPHHMAVQKIDLAGFAAHQVLRGGGFRDCLLDADRQRRPALQALIP